MSAELADRVPSVLRCGLAVALSAAALVAGCRTSAEGGSDAVDAQAASIASASAHAADGGRPRDAAADDDSGVEAGAGAKRGSCPPEMAHIGAFCIDRWEAHLLAEDGGIHPYNARPEAAVHYRAKSAPGALPQAYLSRKEAAAACRQVDKRLCSWIEWRRACQGPSRWRYPYGNDARSGACNTGKDHLMRRFFGNDPLAWTQDAFNDPRLLAEPGSIAKTESHPGCVSVEGVYDMVGNLHEWIADTVTNRFMNKMAAETVYRRKQPWRYGNAMFLGGFFSTRAEHGPGCFFVTVAHEPRYHDYSTGFRCCAAARSEPSRSDAGTH